MSRKLCSCKIYASPSSMTSGHNLCHRSRNHSGLSHTIHGMHLRPRARYGLIMGAEGVLIGQSSFEDCIETRRASTTATSNVAERQLEHRDGHWFWQLFVASSAADQDVRGPSFGPGLQLSQADRHEPCFFGVGSSSFSVMPTKSSLYHPRSCSR